MVKRRTGLDPLAYMGVEPSTPSQFVQESRNPTTTDYDGFNLMNVWLNTVTQQIWMLTNKANFVATWREFTSAAGAVNTLTADTGTNPVPPTGNNIDIFGGTGVGTVGTAAASLITINVDASVALQYDCDAGSAVAVANVLNIVGTGGLTTSGAGNTVTITPGGSVAVQVDADVGSATPALGILNALGGNNISTAAAGNTLTVNISGTTNHALQRGNATGSLTSLAVGTDGQVVIGATGSDPAFATMTSTGGTILFTPGANSLNLETAGAPTTIVTDSGNATVAAGVLNVVGGDNISTSGAGNTVTVAVSGTANFNPQMGNASGSLADIGTMTDGDLIIGSTGVAPQIAQLTAGTGIGIANGAGSITISATGSAVGDTIVTTFNSSGTWTKNANTKHVTYHLYSAGGGGGSGARYATPTGAGTQITGGAGGSVRGYTTYSMPASLMPASAMVTIGAGGSGGAAVLTDNTDGNNGADAGVTTFGDMPGGYSQTTNSYGGPGGVRGSNATTPTNAFGLCINNWAGAIGVGAATLNPGGTGGADFGGGGVTNSINFGGPSSAGGGGGISTSAVATAGVDGGVFWTPGPLGGQLPVQGTAGTGGAPGVSGTAGVDAGVSPSTFMLGGTGAGGGGGHITAPGSGANGGLPGGAGSGGGAVVNGNASGAGGDGAAGQVIIVEYTGA